MIKRSHNVLLILIMAAMISVPQIYAQDHPGIFISGKEAKQISGTLEDSSLLKNAFLNAREVVEAALGKEMELPAPGEAGGYAHERHKQNYREMKDAGLLFAISGKDKYAVFVRDMLQQYAKMYPKLGPHPLSHNQRPGRLFHQTLNEAVWMVNVAQAYDCIYDWLSEEERASLEKNIFVPMARMFYIDHAETFDKIHNHGTWTVAAVGMMGYVMGRKDWVEMALLGTRLDGKGGFLKQLDLLFSPDGYYMEGPYYIRYALSPFFLFAEAIERREPQRKIFEHRDQILRKAFYATARTIFPNGIFPPINDASRTMDIRDIGPLIATNIVYHRYGHNANLLAMAHLQGSVLLNAAGIKLSRDLKDDNSELEINWKSVELSDGADGKQGGLGILRSGSGLRQSMVLMKYGVHGEGHGHFDKLHITFFDQQREILPDYGFARWINIEPKFGGRYLPENNSYAKQTIAHNTVVVDGKTQHDGNRRQADKHSAQRHFFDGNNGPIQVVSAKSLTQYPGVAMQRTVFLIADDRLEYPLVVDLYRVDSGEEHQYDYPLHYRGQQISVNFPYTAHTTTLTPMGKDHGYQHIWQTAAGNHDDLLQFTWLDGQRYYTWSSAASPGSQVVWGRIGANDPDFNLISEPVLVLRRRAKTHLFASVIEPHGYFNEAREKSVNPRSRVANIRVIGHDLRGSVVEIDFSDGFQWQILVNNDSSHSKKNTVRFNGETYSWDGNYAVQLNKETD